jgi:hypothetical protein
MFAADFIWLAFSGFPDSHNFSGISSSLEHFLQLWNKTISVAAEPVMSSLQYNFS